MKELEDLKKILTNDEEVKEYFKPNKKRFVVVNAIMMILMFALCGFAPFIIGILGLTGGIDFVTTENGAETTDYFAPMMFVFFGAIILVLFLFVILGYVVRYKRTIYVVTNKRLIIRSGFIGVDYKSVELRQIGLINVRVDFLDKLIKSNTGTITFASAAIPMYGQNGQVGAFRFACVDNPYEVYKRVKELVPSEDK